MKKKLGKLTKGFVFLINYPLNVSFRHPFHLPPDLAGKPVSLQGTFITQLGGAITSLSTLAKLEAKQSFKYPRKKFMALVPTKNSWFLDVFKNSNVQCLPSDASIVAEWNYCLMRSLRQEQWYHFPQPKMKLWKASNTWLQAAIFNKISLLGPPKWYVTGRKTAISNHVFDYRYLNAAAVEAKYPLPLTMKLNKRSPDTNHVSHGAISRG